MPDLQKGVNKAFGRVDDQFEKVIRGDRVQVDAPLVIGELFGFQHALGVVPTGYDVESEEPVRVWATGDDRRMWDKEKMYLRCDVAEARLYVLARR